MKMRQFKRSKLALMSYALFGPYGPIGQWLTQPVPFIPERGVVLFAVEEAVSTPLYTVTRVKDGEEVLTTTDRTEALALINKHARQKKAKLQAHCDGEPVLFAETEAA